MTTATETLKGGAKKNPAEKGKSAPSPATGGAAGMLITFSLSAIVSGLAGVALNRGFGVSVPFMAGFVLVLAFAFFLRLATLVVASGWQEAAVSAAPRVAAGVVIGSFIAETSLKEAMGAEALKGFEKHLAEAFPAAKDDGGYL